VPAFTEAKRAYTNLDLPVQTARQSEYQIFAKITGQLQAVAAMEDFDVQKRALAIYENQRYCLRCLPGGWRLNLGLKRWH
jgi:hypothetical protein